MNYKLSMMTAALVGFAVLASPSAWAEEKAKTHQGNSGGSCSIESRDVSSQFGKPGSDGMVEQFGALTLRLVTSKGAQGSVVDIKGPNGFLRRNVELNAKVPVVFELCGKEVTVIDTGSVVRVSAF